MKEKKKLTKTSVGTSLIVKPKLKQSRSVVGGTISMLMSATESPRLPHIKKAGAGEVVKASEVDVSVKAREKIRVQMVDWLIEIKERLSRRSMRTNKS